jgi:hypothetical protein
MALNVFTGGRTEESVAYDLAQALALKDTTITTPEELIQRIANLLPAYREAAKAQYSSENPPPSGKVDVNWRI